MEDSARRYKGHPQSAPGDFYVVNGECLSCGVPHVLAPDLFGWEQTDDGEPYGHCVWKKQPQTPDEIDRAIEVIHASEAGCHRYAGSDPSVGFRVGGEYCDHPSLAVARPVFDWSVRAEPGLMRPSLDLEHFLPVLAFWGVSVSLCWLWIGLPLTGTRISLPEWAVSCLTRASWGILAASVATLLVAIVRAAVFARGKRSPQALCLNAHPNENEEPKEE